MKSAKVVNKILLISLAFGSATFVAGLLAEDETQKALIGTGAVGSMAGVAGALVINKLNSSDSDGEDNLSDNRVSELHSQEAQIKQSFDEATVKMQAVEAEINSLQTEHNQLLSIISDLNGQKQHLETEYDSKKQEIEAANVDVSALNSKKQQLETEYVSKKQEIEIVNTDILTLENRKQDLESQHDILQQKIEELYHRSTNNWSK